MNEDSDAFCEWLQNTKCLTKNSADDVISRVKRAKNIFDAATCAISLNLFISSPFYFNLYPFLCFANIYSQKISKIISPNVLVVCDVPVFSKVS
jgi:hypothetical protein